MTVEGRIKKEYKKLLKIYKNIPQREHDLTDPLIKNAAFMRVTLEELQAEINANGVSEAYQNGANQSGMKATPAVQQYNAMVKNFLAVERELLLRLPADDGEKDELDEFLSK